MKCIFWKTKASATTSIYFPMLPIWRWWSFLMTPTDLNTRRRECLVEIVQQHPDVQGVITAEIQLTIIIWTIFPHADITS